ncbi:hypothetical protein Atep_30120 (plasmid) [Allochromatium tepidum]|uniref:Uncharacterized protein n=1 Tax=Allochromatium tepidum TaxID=553982 RepID=A0ABN6GEF2_9GAMM|nr:hypothetical protein Atep_30120 [Allochromatium tepidum]
MLFLDSRSRVEGGLPTVTARRPLGLETPLDSPPEPLGFSRGEVQS